MIGSFREMTNFETVIDLKCPENHPKNGAKIDQFLCLELVLKIDC